MIAMALAVTDGACDDRASMSEEVELLQATLVERLRRAGVRLPESEVAAIADVAMAEAVRLCLAWLERDGRE